MIQALDAAITAASSKRPACFLAIPSPAAQAPTVEWGTEGSRTRDCPFLEGSPPRRAAGVCACALMHGGKGV